MSSRFFEQLEDRTLLSIGPTCDYEHVSPVWFDVQIDPAEAEVASFDFVGPLTLEQYEAVSRLWATSDTSVQMRDQWIVRLTPEATALVAELSDAASLLCTSTTDFRIIRGLGLPGQLLVETSGVSVQQVEAVLRANPLVAHFGSNGMVCAQVVPDDADFSQLWGLHSTGQTGGTVDADIDAPEAWEITTGSSNVVVAVIDSGIDYTHPDLYQNIWINQGEIPAALGAVLTDTDSDGLITFYDLNDPANASHVVDVNSTGYIDAEDLLADASWADTVDNDGNTYADDLVGWNFSGTGTGNKPLDGSRHGTHVAGTIAAMGDNATGTTGVAWRASMMPLKFLDDSNRGTTAEAILAINYATLMRDVYGVNIVVANNSWGYRGESDSNLRAAIEASGEASILFVAASGNGDILGHGIDNDADPAHAFYPASEDLDSILSVAASDDDDRLARFSNYGALGVDIAAPGVSIFSTEPNDDYRSRYGTSMAAPHVSGVAALVWSSTFDATAAEVKEAVLLGGEPLPGPQDQAKLSSGKRLNAHGSLLVDTVAPRPTLLDAPNVDGPGVTETLFSVEFRDDRLVNRASVLASQLLITDVSDRSIAYHATFQSVDITEDSPVCTATYLLTAPGGTWETFDNGDYEIALESGQIADSSSNWALSTPLGIFNVDTTPGLIRVSSFEDAGDADPGDGVADDGTGRATLRAAIMEANAQTAVKNVVRLTPGVYTLSVVGRGEDVSATGDLDITGDLTIRGAGANVTTIDAAGLDRIFHVLSGVTAELVDVGLTGGDPQAEGGGILNTGTLTLTRCEVSASTATTLGGALANAAGATSEITASTFFGNTADRGGAIDNQGELTLTNSTISGNTAAFDGGGICNESGTATLSNVTVATNSAGTGGGIANSSAVTLLNTIIAANSAATNPDLSGVASSSGTNLIGAIGTSTGWVGSDLLDVDALLGPLQDNTGPTLTHALLAGSPAIDAGTNAGAPAVDQRGIKRPLDGDDEVETVDIGAVERHFGEIHGVLFQDDNPNGIREIRELGLPGESVYLDANDNARYDPGESVAVTIDDDPATFGIDEAGHYSFFGVEPGRHRVAPMLQHGWEQTFREPRAKIERVSEGFEIVEVEGNADSITSSISADGRYVAFDSSASNLVPGDTNGERDIFVLDQHTGIIERVSFAPDGNQVTRDCTTPSISADGRYVAFDSGGIFVHDRETGITERVSIASDGSSANGLSSKPSISADGRYVAFESYATNLAPGGDSNGYADVFVHDRRMGTTERVSVNSNGSQAFRGGHSPSISADGQYVAFVSSSPNLVSEDRNGYSDVFVHHCLTGITELVSVASDGTLANRDSTEGVSISADGRFVAFVSEALNLVPGDANASADIFIRDRQEGITERVSVTSTGEGANDRSETPSVSADGRYVAFLSPASNLVPGDTNSAADIFVHDRQTGTTRRASLASDGSQADGQSYEPAISGDGQSVAFCSSASNLVPGDTNGTEDVVVHDRQTGSTRRVSAVLENVEADGYSGSELSLSGDGRYVAFESSASNLVPGDTNSASDIFVHDRLTGTTERVSVASDGSEGDAGTDNATISADGRYVAFTSFASNLVSGDTNGWSDVFVHDRQTRITERVSVASDGTEADFFSRGPSISADGRYVAFRSDANNLVPGDTGGHDDIFVHDRQTGATRRVSVASDGTQANQLSWYASISGDGRYVAFESRASNLVPDDTNNSSDIFVHDCQTGITELVSVSSDSIQAGSASHSSYVPKISGDGRYVVFASDAANLVEDDTNGASDIFVRDRQAGTTERVSVASDGTQANHNSYGSMLDPYGPSISADGRHVAFWSLASNLVPGDTNGKSDIFVHDRVTGSTRRVSVDSDGIQASGVDASSYQTAISADGRYIAFHSQAASLVDGDTNGMHDIFVSTNLPAWQSGMSVADVGVGENVTGVDLAVRSLPGEIRGQVFRDLNRDGFQDPNELGLSGWIVFVDLNENGRLDSGDRSSVTGTFGQYSLGDLEPFGVYTVAAVPQDYWVQTCPILIDGGVWNVELDAGTLADDIDFGYFYAGPGAQNVDIISGSFFRDLNVNGRQDVGEPGLANWQIFLDQDDDGVLSAGEENTFTDASGYYEFTGVAADAYTVRAVAQAGWTLTNPLENVLSATSFGQGRFDQTQAVTTGDFDGDGDSDIAASHGEYVSLLRNLGSGAFEFWQEINVGAGAYALVANDFDDDGDPDLAVANYYASTLSVLLNQSDPLTPFGSAITTDVGSLPRFITAGQFNDDDLDGDIDGRDYLDVAIAHENGYNDVYVDDNQVSILCGNGDGSFQAPRNVAAGNSPVAVVTGQFNDDNHDGHINELDALDLAVANFDSADVSLLVNDRMGSFDVGLSVPAGSGPISLATGDLDGDGDLDLAVADLLDGDVSILRNTNGSFIRLPASLPAGAGPQAVIAADLEGDGDVDLIVSNNTAEHLGVLRNHTIPGTGVIEYAPLESFGVANFDGGPSYSVVAEYFDMDSTLDLAVAVGETSWRIGAGEPDAPQNYVSVMLNDVFAGAHRVTVTGVDPVPELNFGVRPAGGLVVDRHVFYNHSWYDGNDPAANANDDNAVATDKAALLPGEVAAFENYTSYDHGINGIMIDVAEPTGTATIDDFAFKVGNSSDLANWTALSGTDSPAVSVRPGAGTTGSDRITLTWPDGTIQQQWLQVTILAGGNLGLPVDDVFYFGNAIGDSGEGNPSGVATAFISDELGARNNPHDFLNRALVDDVYDYNRDSIVFISDELIARNHGTNFLTGLELITAPAGGVATAPAGVDMPAEQVKLPHASPIGRAEHSEYVDATMEDTDPAWLPFAGIAVPGTRSTRDAEVTDKRENELLDYLIRSGVW